MPLFLLDPRVWFRIAGVVAVGLILWFVASSLIGYGSDKVQAKWDTEKARDAAAVVLAKDKAREDTRLLQIQADTERRNKDEKLKILAANLDYAISQLHSRPPRPSQADMPKVADAGPLCTGAGLYRDDAEVLTRLAASAKSTTLQLESCEADYARAVNTVNAYVDSK